MTSWHCLSMALTWFKDTIQTWEGVGRPWPFWSLLGRCCSHSTRVWLNVCCFFGLLGNFAIIAFCLWNTAQRTLYRMASGCWGCLFWGWCWIWKRLMNVVPTGKIVLQASHPSMIAMVIIINTINWGLGLTKPGDSVADIPSKHTASATSRRFTAVENQPKPSVHHLVMLLMFLL